MLHPTLRPSFGSGSQYIRSVNPNPESKSEGPSQTPSTGPQPTAKDAEAANDEATLEIKDPTPGEVFTVRLRGLLNTFSLRQSEVLRVSEFLDDRATELNDAKLRAKRRIQQALAEVDDEVLDRYLRVVTGFDEDAEQELTSSERTNALIDALRELGTELPEGTESTYMNAVLRTVRPSVGPSFLHSSLLMTLVGELEMVINQIARACFEIRPTSLQESGKTFTWAEISDYDSIDDLRDNVVDRTIDDLLRGSLQDWTKFFENRFKIGPVKAAASFEAVEAVQRRHCIVHNAGAVSNQYLEKLAGFSIDTKLNDPLPVDKEYLERAADTLYLVAYSLIWALGVQLNPEERWRTALVNALTNRTMFLLQEGRFDLVRQIGESAPIATMKGEDLEYAAFILQVNRWIAMKELGQFGRERDAVQNLPVRNRDNSYKLARFALLDLNEEAYELAQRMIADGDLMPEHLLTWPLLRGVRDYARSRLNDPNEPGTDLPDGQ